MSKLSKLRNSPARFFADSKHPALRAVGRVLAPPMMRSEFCLSLLESPMDTLGDSGLPLLAPLVDARRRSQQRQRRARITEAGGPLVSVVMAARNAAATIEGAVDSVLAQSHQELDIVVVDDVSEDDTADIVRSIARRDTRVRLLLHPERRGAAPARNYGLREARGAYLTFHDADDRSHPERIERQLAALLEAGGHLCVCNSVRETAEGQRVVVNGRRFSKSFISMLFPRDPVFERVGYMRELTTGEDAEYYARIRAAFGAAGEVHLSQTLYRAQFLPTSLLFSNGETNVSAHDVTYVQAPTHKHALDAALERMDAIQAGLSDPFVPFAG